MEQETSASETKQQKIFLLILGIIIVVGLLSLAGMFIFRWGQGRKLGEPIPTPTPMPEVTPSITLETSPSPSLSPTPRVTTRPTTTPTPTAEPTLTPAPTQTPSLTPTLTPTLTPAPQADLYISEYSFDHPPKQGEAFTVRIGLYNQGNANAGPFWWEWWPTWAAKACRERISEGIVAHGGRIVTCTYTYGGWANYETKAVVDADNEVPESNETNNTHVENVVPIH